MTEKNIFLQILLTNLQKKIRCSMNNSSSDGQRENHNIVY